MFFKLILENENSGRVEMTTIANQYMTLKSEMWSFNLRYVAVICKISRSK